jgi:hypothetical protein
MKELVEYIAKAIVNAPDDVVVTEESDDQGTTGSGSSSHAHLAQGESCQTRHQGQSRNYLITAFFNSRS